MTEPEVWMKRALDLARHAAEEGEVPIGCVVVEGDDIIGEGWNQPVSTRDPTAHAEVIALRSAATLVNNYRLPGADLYVTLEPCVMCTGAIIHARISRLIFGARDPRGGAAGSVFDIPGTGRVNHAVAVTAGVLEQECATILQEFFRARR